MDLGLKIDTLQKLGIPCIDKGITYKNSERDTLWGKPPYKRIAVAKAEQNIKTADIPCGVKEIADSAFMGSTVQEVTLPETLTIISPHAFSACPRLEKVNLDDVKFIGERAFSFTGLKEITLTDAFIQQEAFTNSSHLEKVTLNGRCMLGAGVFRDTPIHSINLSKVTNPNLPSRVFMGSDLAQLVVPSHITSMDSYCCAQCTNLVSVKLQGSKVKINDCAFLECFHLAEVNMDRVEQIMSFAFEGWAIQEADLRNCRRVDTGAFNQCLMLYTVKLPYQLREIDTDAFCNCTHIGRVYLPHDLEPEVMTRVTSMFPTMPKYIVSDCGSTCNYLSETFGDESWELET